MLQKQKKKYNRQIRGWESDFIRLTYPEFDTQEIANILGRPRQGISCYCQRNKINKAKKVPEIGTRFGKLVVIKRGQQRFKFRQEQNKLAPSDIRWECQCDCGKVTNISTYDLMTKGTKSCGCGRIEAISYTEGDITGVWYGNTKKQAEARNMEFALSIEFLDKLYKKQNKRCALTGLSLSIPPGRYKNSTTASLDRIDNNRGYVEDNVQFVHKHVNYMKWKHTTEYLFELCKLIYLNNKDKYDIGTIT